MREGGGETRDVLVSHSRGNTNSAFAGAYQRHHVPAKPPFLSFHSFKRVLAHVSFFIFKRDRPAHRHTRGTHSHTQTPTEQGRRDEARQTHEGVRTRPTRRASKRACEHVRPPTSPLPAERCRLKRPARVIFRAAESASGESFADCVTAGAEHHESESRLTSRRA